MNCYVLSGQQICQLGLISPSVDEKVNNVSFSYGPEAGGYTVRAGENVVVNPNEVVIIPFVETIVPNTTYIVEVYIKSSWLRKGLVHISHRIKDGLEVKNIHTEPISVPKGAGLCQVIFKGYR